MSHKRMKQISERQRAHCEAIDKLDINGIIDRYWGKADEFELVSPFDRRYYDKEAYEKKYPYGKYKLAKTDAEYALRILEEKNKKYLRKVYENGLSDKQKAKFPPFETLYEDIKSECIAISEMNNAGDNRADEYIFACDLVYDGKTKYTKPHDVFWHFYAGLGGLCGDTDNAHTVVNNLMSNPYKRSVDYPLHKPPYDILLPHLIAATPTFTWHCTTSGGLYVVYRFRFNEQTKAWLAVHYNLKYCFRYGLEDLALYRGNELLFSQCTHEHMQSDYMEKFDD